MLSKSLKSAESMHSRFTFHSVLLGQQLRSVLSCGRDGSVRCRGQWLACQAWQRQPECCSVGAVSRFACMLAGSIDAPVLAAHPCCSLPSACHLLTVVARFWYR